MRMIALVLTLAAGPAIAATGAFVSMQNTDFVVLIAFLIFVGIVIYAKVPQRIAGMLDARAASIRSDLDEARALREEARALFASYERKQREVQAQSERIIASARDEAMAAAAAARDDLKATIARKITAAEDQIAAAEAGAVRAIRDQAVTIAVAAAAEVIAARIGPQERDAMTDSAIREVGARLN